MATWKPTRVPGSLPLGSKEICLGKSSDGVESLPAALQNLLERSDNLYRRIARLDAVLFGDEAPVAGAREQLDTSPGPSAASSAGLLRPEFVARRSRAFNGPHRSCSGRKILALRLLADTKKAALGPLFSNFIESRLSLLQSRRTSC